MKKICFGMICILLSAVSLQAKPLEEILVRTFADESIAFQEINTLADFNTSVLEKQGLVIVDFYSQACPGCIKMLPSLESLAHRLSDKITIVKSDIHNSVEILRDMKLNQELQVTSVPSIFIFKDGNFLDQVNGVMSNEELFTFVNKYMQD